MSTTNQIMDYTKQLTRDICAEYNLIHHILDNGDQLRDQSFNDIQWYKRLYSLRKLAISNIFNVAPEINIIEDDSNKEVIKNNILETAIQDTNKTKSYYAFFAASNLNIVFATISLSGDIVFISKAIDLLKTNSSEEFVMGIIKKVCEYNRKVLDVYHRNINSDLLKNDLVCYLLNDLCQKLGSGYLDYENNITKVGFIIEDVMKTLFRDEKNSPMMYQLLLNQNEMYRTVLGQYMKNQDELERKALSRGVLIGSKFFTGFQRAGYVYNISTGCWEKNVNMKPAFCVWGDQLYKIPNEYQHWEIKTLRFDPSQLTGESFIMHSSGNHPNVGSGGQICIGDTLSQEFRRLIRSRELMPQEYVSFAIKVEDALKIINFDSSYSSFENGTGADPSDALELASVAERPTGTVRSSLRRV